MKQQESWKQPEIQHGVPTKWGWIVLHPENLKLGRNTDIGAFSLIQAEYGVIIGNDVQIGGGCMIYSKNTIDGTQGEVIIRSGAKIGANTTILPGSYIGKGVTVGANSLVKDRDVLFDPGTYVGTPVKGPY